MPVATIRRGGQLRDNWDNYAERFAVAATMYGRSEEWTSACLAYALSLKKSCVPVIYDQEHFSRLCGISPVALDSMVWNKKSYYKRWRIPKKKCGEFRDICEPLPSLKQVQRFIHKSVYKSVPVSGYNFAYISGRGVKQHAQLHSGRKYVYAVDIKDFFSSISPERLFGLNRYLGYSVGLSWLFASLCTFEGGLPQGAPTSPILSNLISRRLDRRLSQLARSAGMVYSRYADDIFFSSSSKNANILKSIGVIVVAEGFELNHSKTRILTNSRRQIVTGAVVNQRVRVSGNIKKKIRQEVYYINKHGLLSHIDRRGIERSNYLGHLIGRIGWALYLDPSDSDLIQWNKEMRALT